MEYMMTLELYGMGQKVIPGTVGQDVRLLTKHKYINSVNIT